MKLSIFCILVISTCSCGHQNQETRQSTLDSIQWENAKESFLKPCIQKSITSGFKDEVATHYCNCEFNKIKHQYSIAEVTKEGFVYRRDVIDSLTLWLDNCLLEKKDHSGEWGDLPKQQIRDICQSQMKHQKVADSMASNYCDCFTMKVITNVAPGHLSDQGIADSIQKWSRDCTTQYIINKIKSK